MAQSRSTSRVLNLGSEMIGTVSNLGTQLMIDPVSRGWMAIGAIPIPIGGLIVTSVLERAPAASMDKSLPSWIEGGM